MRGRVQAMMGTALFGVLAIALAPFVYVSGAIVGLSTLRNGESQGLIVFAGASAIFGIISALLFNTIIIGLIVAFVFWTPTLVLCIGLRATSSQSLALTFGAMLAALSVLIFHFVVGDTGAWWRHFLDQFIATGLQGMSEEPDGRAVVMLVQKLDEAAPMMAGLLAAGLLSSAFMMTLMARWFHSILDNPGGFGREFQSLSLNRKVGIAVLLLGGLGLISDGFVGGFARDVIWLAIVLYLFQGIAVVHGIVAQLSASVGWLVLLYVLLIIATVHVLLLLTLTGFLDTWLKLRSRIGNRPASS